MISINDIAQDIQSLLGDKFKLWVDNNASQFNIPKGMTLDGLLTEQQNKIHCLMTTSSGDIVALKDLFSTSFSYMIQFYVPTDTNIETNLQMLVEALNGVLNDVGTDKYLITFNSPTAVGTVQTQTGIYRQEIQLSGSIAITDNSLFGNELQIAIDGTELIGLINGDLSLSPENTSPASTDGTYVPIIETNYINSTISLVVHMRKDSDLYHDLLNYQLNCDLLMNKYFTLDISIGTKNISWNTKLLGLSTSFAIGGYVIMNLSFVRSQVIA